MQRFISGAEGSLAFDTLEKEGKEKYGYCDSGVGERGFVETESDI